MIFSFSKSELIFILIVLVGLFSVSFLNYQVSLAKSRDSQRRSETSKLAKSLDDYFYDNDRYPASDPKTGYLMACGDPRDIQPCKWGDKFGSYQELPNDPIYPNRKYFYQADKEGTKYKLWAALEYPTASDLVTIKDTPMCGDTRCNYGESSFDINSPL